jgi:transposase
VPRTGGTRGQSDGRDHRQPERQRSRKRGRCIDPSGYDAGKKIKGKKRHVLVDSQGLLMQAIIHAADIQDRDGGVLLMGSLFGLYPFLLKLYADSGYQGPKFQAGLRAVCGQVNLEIVKRSDLQKFVVLPKRWIVERTIGWLNRCRRLAKDWECLNRSALTFLRWASARIMLRRLCQETR